MKPSNKENEVASTVKDTTKYVFVAPGAIGKGRGRGHKFVRSLGDKTNIPFSPSTDQVMQYNQTVETSPVAKGRGLGLKSMCRLQALGNEVGSFHKSTRSDSTMSIDQGIRPMNKNPLILEKWQMQTNIPSVSSTDQVMKYIQANSTSALGKERGLRSKCSIEVSKNEVGSFDENSHYASQNMSRLSNSTRSASTMSTTQGLRTTNKNSLVHEKEHMQTEISISPSTDQVMKSTQTVETSALGKERERGPRSMCSFEVSENEAGSFHQNAHYASQSMSRPFNITRSNSTIVAGQGLRTANKNPYVHDKEHMQTDISVSPSTDQVTQPTQTVETSLCSTEKVKKVRGSNKCKEVASLEVGQKLKVTFYNNRTVGKNSNLFSRHLGKIVRDRNMCPLGVSKWNDIKEEKLNHMWAAVKDKFESDDMDIHRDHILGWMKELWNKWRGQLHSKHVKGKPIQEALKNVPKGVDKKQWELLVKEHFLTESFQARSNKNAANRAKLKMLHHIGSKPIREIIYQKGGKDGNPPDLATIFFETRKKNDTLVNYETIKKHAQIQELVQSEPSLPTIEIVEKCFGPQTRSHVFGFGGGVKAKDFKGGTSSKVDLLSELRSTREENQSLKERLSNFENEMKELTQLKEWFLAQHSNFQPPTSKCSGE